MIKSFKITNPKGESLLLELTKPQASGLYVQNVEGLGPAKAQINTTDLAVIDGSIFSSSRITERNIVMTLGMMEVPSVEHNRLLTYRYFPVKKEVTIHVKTDTRNAYANGVVESNEPIIFSERESTQISILCSDPFFYEIEREEPVISGIRPIFEFPFSNESLHEPMLETGQVDLDKRAIINYYGDVDTGVIIQIHAFATATNIEIHNVDTLESIKIDTAQITAITGQSFRSGDDIIISTIRGKRYMRLLRNGVYTNIIGAFNRTSKWLQLTPGENVFTFTAATGENDINVTFMYHTAYGGM